MPWLIGITATYFAKQDALFGIRILADSLATFLPEPKRIHKKYVYHPETAFR
jgi:hypothetical protein